MKVGLYKKEENPADNANLVSTTVQKRTIITSLWLLLAWYRMSCFTVHCSTDCISSDEGKASWWQPLITSSHPH